MSIRISLRLGGYWRIMPFLFSLPPRCQLEYGSAKHVCMPSSSRRRVWWANSMPLSCVTPTRAPAGSGDQPRPGHSATRVHGRSHDRRWRLRGLARLRPVPVVSLLAVYAVALARFGAPAAGPAPRGAGDAASARPRACLQPFRPARPAGPVLVGREPTCCVWPPCRPSRRCGRASDRSRGCRRRCRSRSG